MSSWTNVDEAAGAPLWAVEAIRKEKSNANRTDLFNERKHLSRERECLLIKRSI